MEMTLNNGFCEMTQNDMQEVDGGSVWGKVAKVAAEALIAALAYEVTDRIIG